MSEIEQKTTEEGAFVGELAQEIGRVVVAKTAELENRIRTNIRAELQAEQDEKIQQSVDEALAFHAPDLFGPRRGEGLEGGFLHLENDSSLAARAQFLMSESWTPLAVKMGGDGRIDDRVVMEALKEFIAGAPLREGIIGSDEDSSILMGIMESCEQKYTIDPHAKSIVDNMTNYIVGQGLEFNCTVDVVEDELKKFAKRVGLKRRLKEAVRRKYKFGEHYFFYHIDPRTGDVYIRDRTKPYQIKSIKTHPEDAETRLAYGRSIEVQDGRLNGPGKNKHEWFADVNYWEQKGLPGGATAHGCGKLGKLKLVQMVKYGDSSQVRGTPPMYPALRYLKYYEDFILDRIVLNHERSKVVWVRKVSGSRSLPGGRAQRGPVGGQILTETPQLEWKTINAQINADDASADGRLIRLAICSSQHLPEHVLFQDASEQVYASIRTQDTPFSYNVRSEQQDWHEDAQEMFRIVIREKVAAKKLPPKVEVEVFTTEGAKAIYNEVVPMLREGASKEDLMSVLEALGEEAPTEMIKVDTVDVQVDARFSDVVQQDPLKMAQEAEILDRVGLFSKTELSAKLGGNYKRTVLLKNLENKWLEKEEEPEDSEGEEDAGGEKKSNGKKSYGKKSDPPSDKPDKDDE